MYPAPFARGSAVRGAGSESDTTWREGHAVEAALPLPAKLSADGASALLSNVSSSCGAVCKLRVNQLAQQAIRTRRGRISACMCFCSP